MMLGGRFTSQDFDCTIFHRINVARPIVECLQAFGIIIIKVNNRTMNIIEKLFRKLNQIVDLYEVNLCNVILVVEQTPMTSDWLNTFKLFQIKFKQLCSIFQHGLKFKLVLIFRVVNNSCQKKLKQISKFISKRTKITNLRSSQLVVGKIFVALITRIA